MEKRYSPRSGKYYYIYEYSEQAKNGRNKAEKHGNVDIEASRGHNHYVMEDGSVSKQRRPKLYSDYMKAYDWIDRKEMCRQRIEDAKNGKPVKRGKMRVTEILSK